ncbi:LacI family DNA-binding transcriptional regulator [Vannielia sp.]|uniref:LacI family DNA-binding transcriptional regulator n=1 Tax=Vannielia sp. TaxID=2813045 RepID=UPI00260A585A|nr:LacI family DNA-binding transcriptional regulator [Vannielia sp.]MDF1871940.1 LacI family DNA-binding transcriptional regulator [Vannielia sp.]
MGADKDRDQKRRIDTMEELAVAIGVSRPTLSRYFQDPERVSRTSRERIAQGLERVEYVPNFFATRLNRKSTGIIGVVIPYLNDLFFTKLLEAIERAAMAEGYTVITQCSHSDPLIEARAAETFMSMSVDGALVAPLGNQSDMKAHERLRSRLPCVLVDSRPKSMPNVDFVGSNHVQSTGLATEYLCRVGTPPIFLAMPRVNFNAMERELAYIAKMEELGHEPHIIGTEVLNDDGLFEAHGRAVLDREFAAGRLLESSVLCANDRVAIGALRAAASHGLEPGAKRQGGLRIMGHDDYPLCPFAVPSLTTVAQDVEAIGRASVSRLVKTIQAQKNQDEQIVKLFDGELKVRDSA